MKAKYPAEHTGRDESVATRAFTPVGPSIMRASEHRSPSRTLNQPSQKTSQLTFVWDWTTKMKPKRSRRLLHEFWMLHTLTFCVLCSITVVNVGSKLLVHRGGNDQRFPGPACGFQRRERSCLRLVRTLGRITMVSMGLACEHKPHCAKRRESNALV